MGSMLCLHFQIYFGENNCHDTITGIDNTCGASDYIAHDFTSQGGELEVRRKFCI